MNRLSCLDTNILLYGEDYSVPAKQKRASALIEGLLRQGSAVFSMQVLQEFFSAATRKLNLAPEEAQRKVEIFSLANVVRIETADLIAAIELHRLIKISFWDALIVHAARISGAAILYSEDFQHGAVLGGVRVVNPFIDPK